MTESSDQPIRRISTWKAFGLFFLVAFLILLGVVFIPWDVKAPDDADLRFTPLTLDADKNAFTYFAAAGRMLVQEFPPVDGVERKVTDLLPTMGSAKEKWDPEFAAEVLMANAAAFKEVEMGLACEHYASPVWSESKGPNLRVLQKDKVLCQLLSVKSKQAQLAGDSLAAEQAAAQAWRFGQLVMNDANSYIEWLVGNACQGIALHRFKEIIADSRTPEPVLRECLAQLGRWDPSGPVRGYRQVIKAEYRCLDDSIRNLRSHPQFYVSLMSDPIYYFAWIPYCFKTNMTKQTMVRVFCGYSENVDRTYADHCRNNPVKNQPAGWLDKIRLFISPNSVGKQFPAFYDYWGTTIARKCWLPADVATLRLRTALRLYELKHAQLPDDLSALVPEYLQEIPRDPYDGKPVRYSKAEKKLWTVGRDLTDNGGKMENGEEMQDSPGCDLVMPLGTREMKPTLAFPPVINEWGN